MTTPAQAKAKLLRKWERGLFFAPAGDLFPYSHPLGQPSSREMTDRFDQVRRWIDLCREGEGRFYRLDWREINHRRLGRNRLPKALLFDGPEELARFLGKLTELNRFIALRGRLELADSRLALWADRSPKDLLTCGDDINRLISLWQWMVEHPRSGLYLRQIDVSRVDTKFTARYKRILSAWLDLTLPESEIWADASGVGGFEERYGFLKKPDLVRMRFLDSRLDWYGCSDVTLEAGAFCRLDQSGAGLPERVFVVENDVTALAFPPVEGGMVLFGRGYHFDHLRRAEWLGRTDLRYWGDLDTHGFRILDQFRDIFPGTRSFLMDRKTLLDHETSWGREEKPTSADLSRLDEAESLLYDDLRFNRLGRNVRLEQEFIRFGALEVFLASSP